MTEESSKTVRLLFWDLPSSLESPPKSFFAGSHAVLVAFDLSKASTFYNLGLWFDMLKISTDLAQLHSIYLVGTKSDLDAEIRDENALELAQKWSKELGKTIPFVKVSPKEPSSGTISLDDLLQKLATEIARQMSLDVEEPETFTAKVIVLGELGVGKTTLIRTLSGQKFRSQYLATIGADFTSVEVSLPIGKMYATYTSDVSEHIERAKEYLKKEKKVEKREVLEPPTPRPASTAPPLKIMKKEIEREKEERERSRAAPPQPPIIPIEPAEPLTEPEPEVAKPTMPPLPEGPPLRLDAKEEAAVEDEVSLSTEGEKPVAPPPPGAAPAKPEEGAVALRGEMLSELDKLKDIGEDRESEEIETEEPAEAPITPKLPASPPLAGVPRPAEAEEEEEARPPPSKPKAPLPAPTPAPTPARRAVAAPSAEPKETKKKKRAKPSAVPAKTTEPTRFSKDCKVAYYDIMNPEKFYELIVHLSDIPLDVKAPVTSLVTGERRTEVKKHVEIATEKIPLVTIRPIFPGCLITPSELETDFRNPDERLTFFVTPLVKGSIPNARIELYLHNKELIATIPTATRVVDPRIARVIAAMGFAIGLGPKAMEYGFEIDFNENLAEAMPFLDDLLGSVDFLLLLELGLLGFFILLATGLFIKYRPHFQERDTTL
ncbi:MAG: hypothetical protein ACFFB3_10780 [Candidatus Hodarchaeota archaeon]